MFYFLYIFFSTDFEGDCKLPNVKKIKFLCDLKISLKETNDKKFRPIFRVANEYVTFSLTPIIE